MRNTYCGVISIKLKNMIAPLHSFSVQNCLIPDIPNSKEERNQCSLLLENQRPVLSEGVGLEWQKRGGV